MLEALFGSINRERVLLFLYVRKEGYSREISRFFEENRYFRHPETKFFLEFPAGPLSVGSEPVKATVTLEFPTGQLALLSPTDCVKDRLAAYYHWSDQQSLAQALLVAESNRIDIGEIRRWSGGEEKLAEFETIRQQLLARRNRP